MSALTAIASEPVTAVTVADKSSPPAMSERTSRLLHGPIVPIMLAMAWPNVLVMLAQASTGLIETWFVSRLASKMPATFEEEPDAFLSLVDPVLQKARRGDVAGLVT